MSKPQTPDMAGKLTELAILLEKWGAGVRYPVLQTVHGYNEQLVDDFRARVAELAEEAHQLAKTIDIDNGPAIHPW